MTGTIIALIPPILAIVISLLTKEVNISLIVGVAVGALLYCNFDPFYATTLTFDIMAGKVRDNMGVFIFIILLGMIVHLMILSGASHEYAKWAIKKIKTRKQTLLTALLLGLIIFVDDYCNCITVGTIMQPITDSQKISREKLAFIIDATAAPVCIIAPLSSWAAAVSSSMPDGSSINGFKLFISTIACNYYTWFILAVIFFTTLFSVDFGKMLTFEKRGPIYIDDDIDTKSDSKIVHKGKVIDLLLPVVFIIVLSILSMLYTGGLFTGESQNVADAFANCDAIISLAMGAFYTTVLMAILYLPRKIVTPTQFMNGLVEGFKNMVPTTLILTFAWSISSICGPQYLNAGKFVSDTIQHYSISLNLMPAIFFLISLVLAFSTGTSWGTFGILIPITVSVFGDTMSSVMVLTTAAVLGGSVCGDHISPISDTTILSSATSHCKHIDHVESQMPYGFFSAAVAFVFYLIAGLLKMNIAGLIGGLVTIFLIVFVMSLSGKYKVSA